MDRCGVSEYLSSSSVVFVVFCFSGNIQDAGKRPIDHVRGIRTGLRHLLSLRQYRVQYNNILILSTVLISRGCMQNMKRWPFAFLFASETKQMPSVCTVSTLAWRFWFGRLIITLIK